MDSFNKIVLKGQHRLSDGISIEDMCNGKIAICVLGGLAIGLELQWPVLEVKKCPKGSTL